MAFGIQIIGLDRLRAGFNAAPAVVQAQTRTAMTTSCLLIEGAARSIAPKKTGRMAGSITHRISGGGANLTGEIGPSVKYGIYVEYGTRPHWMPPGILPFPAMRTIAQRGTRAQPYMKPAFDQNVGRVTKMFSDIGFQVVQRIAS
jgi:HK97 gp10 family phage protein